MDRSYKAAVLGVFFPVSLLSSQAITFIPMAWLFSIAKLFVQADGFPTYLTFVSKRWKKPIHIFEMLFGDLLLFWHIFPYICSHSSAGA